MYLSERTLHEVTAMTADGLILHRTVVEVFREVVEGADLDGGTSVELKSLTLGIEHAEPAHVGMVARLLRTDIGEVLIGNLGLIDAEELGVVTIAVVLDP